MWCCARYIIKRRGWMHLWNRLCSRLCGRARLRSRIVGRVITATHGKVKDSPNRKIECGGYCNDAQKAP